jgi:hypothetical protein
MEQSESNSITRHKEEEEEMEDAFKKEKKRKEKKRKEKKRKEKKRKEKKRKDKKREEKRRKALGPDRLNLRLLKHRGNTGLLVCK